MHLRHVLNLVYFLSDLGALYALHHAPNFYEIHPWCMCKSLIATPKSMHFDLNEQFYSTN